MLSKQQKIKLVEELAEILKNNPSVLFFDFSGLTMGELITLKKELKKESIKFKALKKSLLSFAFKKSGREEFDLSAHQSSVAVAYSSNESDAAMAKIVNNFIIKNKKGIILGGYLLGEKMLKDAVVALAQLPPREVLLAQVLQLMMSPISGLARALDGISKKVAV